MKNYVYKVRKTGIVYNDLSSAVQGAIDDIAMCVYPTDIRLSKPVVVKTNGGYNVIIIAIDGTVLKRGIDVFVPKQLIGGKKFAIDEVNIKRGDLYKMVGREEDIDGEYDIADEDEEDEEKEVYCAYCGALINKDEDDYDYDEDGDIMCAQCMVDLGEDLDEDEEDIVECDYCGKLVNLAKDDYDFDEDGNLMCSECMEKEDDEDDECEDDEDDDEEYLRCARCGEEVPEVDGDYNKDGEFICDDCWDEELDEE